MKVSNSFTSVDNTATQSYNLMHPTMVSDGQVRVLRLFSISFDGSQLKWSVREIECIYSGVKLFEDLLDNDNISISHKLTTGKLLR
jgi:hypothetical protein